MILGIESSCDESALALFDPKRGMQKSLVHSQIHLHQTYGGIVPDLASREHLKNFPVLLKQLQSANLEGVELVAVTAGPGLAGCLALGISLAKALAFELECGLVGVNHLRGHAFSPFISLHEADPAEFSGALSNLLPHLGLIVSGGNTLLFSIERDHKVRILGETQDDAAGEALDKGAKLLGMPYPGGPLIEKRGREGNSRAYAFPRAFLKQRDLRFSFSGLKTSLRYLLEKMSDAELESALPDICASYQAAVVDALAGKTEQVVKEGSWASIGLSGGVANNASLKQAFQRISDMHGLPLFVANPGHTGDNADMIAFASYADPSGVIASDDPRELSFHPVWRLA